ncbi:MAG: hypothetical protein GY862_21915 [Gammaproteobacteria bacterium]|nr:hypothetical protein [Gammaproteobacteria bacterium]
MPDPDKQPRKLIALSELIAQVKEDLLSEVKNNSEHGPLLFVDEIEVAAQVVANQEEGGEAGVKLSVLNFFAADAKVKSQTGNEHMHTVKIKLSPLVSKQEYLQSLNDEEKKQLMETAKKAIPRGDTEQDSLDTA